MAKILIGIDCGVNTGVCVLIGGKFKELKSMKIHEAMQLLESEIEEYETYIHAEYSTFENIPDLGNLRKNFHVFVEDARKRGANPYDKNAHFKQQGAGSVKRDAKIWEDFLNDLGVPFTLVSPLKNKTKLTHEQFCKRTGWSGGKTNEHMRDAAMLVF